MKLFLPDIPLTEPINFWFLNQFLRNLGEALMQPNMVYRAISRQILHNFSLKMSDFYVKN